LSTTDNWSVAAPLKGEVKVTCIAQLAPGDKLPPQLSVSANQSPRETPLLIVSVPPPMFFSVKVCGLLVLPTTMPLKISPVGWNSITGTAGDET
jgi:hypothetical protein